MIDTLFVPTSEEELAACLADPMWRICSGQLYKIMVKSDGGDGSVIPFVPNPAQRRLIARLWHRNLILKARQLGFTTLVAILWLDHALFNADQRCGIIAQDREAAEAIFRDKVKLAYDRLPDELRAAMLLARDSASELLFAHNNSSIRVATSMRSGTIHRLHVSEFGKVCAKYPDKAKEIVTGSLPAVPLDGIVIIESTAEGQEGDFYTMSARARELAENKASLTERDYRFHFYPWWQEPAYRIAGAHVVIGAKDLKYFSEVEAEMSIELDQAQRAWYVATRDADFSGDAEKMWQEYPSTPGEPFKVSTEGCYYAVQMATARTDCRITKVPMLDGVPVNTFWDIGNSDGTAVWLHQQVGLIHRFFHFIEGWGEPYSFFTREMQSLGCLWGTHYLPHDAAHQRQQFDRIAAPIDELKKSGIAGEWVIVPVVSDINHGIQLVRQQFGSYWFDETACKDGLIHLLRYQKRWNTVTGNWSSVPRKDDGHSEAADALRQHAQGYQEKMARTPSRRATPNWRAA